MVGMVVRDQVHFCIENSQENEVGLEPGMSVCGQVRACKMLRENNNQR